MEVIKNISGIFFIACLLVVLYFCYLIFKPFLVVIFVSGALAVTFHPLYQKILNKFGGREGLSSITTVFLIIMIIIDKYIAFKANPGNDKKDDAYFCSEAGVSLSELKAEKKKYKTWAKSALNMRREHYAEKMVEIDKSLFMAAKNGDTKAAELLYRRFDQWNPKIVEQNNNFYNFADLVKGIKDAGTQQGRRPPIIRKSEE